MSEELSEYIQDNNCSDKERKLNIAIQLIAVALISIIINALIKVIWGESS